jgi:hypothetical protein
MRITHNPPHIHFDSWEELYAYTGGEFANVIVQDNPELPDNPYYPVTIALHLTERDLNWTLEDTLNEVRDAPNYRVTQP